MGWRREELDDEEDGGSEGVEDEDGGSEGVEDEDGGSEGVEDSLGVGASLGVDEERDDDALEDVRDDGVLDEDVADEGWVVAAAVVVLVDALAVRVAWVAVGVEVDAAGAGVDVGLGVFGVRPEARVGSSWSGAFTRRCGARAARTAADVVAADDIMRLRVANVTHTSPLRIAGGRHSGAARARASIVDPAPAVRTLELWRTGLRAA